MINRLLLNRRHSRARGWADLLAKGLALSFDTRQIQTAVLGDPESDDPVVCPTDSVELDEFRQEYLGATFWCGVLLGGCGGQLMTRRGNARVSHFAHFPDPDGILPSCGRRSPGVASADHLYVKAATQAWLRGQGHNPRYRYAERDNSPIGSLVEIALGGHKIDLYMDRTTPPSLGADAGDIILGPGVTLDHLTLARRGYVNRVRFDSDGNKRVMILGTELPHVGTEWNIDLADCTIDEHGRLITPVVARLQAERRLPPATDTAPATPTADAVQPAARQQPRSAVAEVPAQIGALARRINTAVREKETAVVRQLHTEAERELARCEAQAYEHLQTAIKHAEDWISRQNRIRQLLFTRIDEAVQHSRDLEVLTLVPQVNELLKHDKATTPEESSILVSADALLRDARRRPGRPAPPRLATSLVPRRKKPTRAQRQSQRQALARARSVIGQLRVKGIASVQEKQLIGSLVPLARTAGDLLSVAERYDVDKWAQKLADPTQWPSSEGAAAALPEPEPPVQHGGTSARLVPVAAAVRGALKKAARERTATSWERLESQLGSALPRLTTHERVQVLTMVDRAKTADAPLLSSLLAAGDPDFAPHYRSVITALGLEAPDDDDTLRDVIEADVEQVYTNEQLR
ncbi:hypothetical protein [Streptomyces sp. NPDC048659]|uniref:hypothetical protein n=1 Tax=Streptomyces sp. NPDC048659 TaxID=3155489 RepID=UPI003422ACF0